jgi:hypothetical protein
MAGRDLTGPKTQVRVTDPAARDLQKHLVRATAEIVEGEFLQGLSGGLDAKSIRSKRFCHDPLPVRTFVRIFSIMERREKRIKSSSQDFLVA